MKHILIISTFIFLTFYSLAQEQPQNDTLTTGDKILMNNPNYANLMIQAFILFDTDIILGTKDYPERANATYNLSASYYFDNLPLELMTQYSGSFYDNLKSDYYKNKSDNLFAKYNLFDFVFTYNFFDKLIDEEVDVTMGSKIDYSKNERTIYTSRYKGRTRKRIGFRLGVFHYNQPITLGYADGQQVVFDDGTKLPMDQNMPSGVTGSYPLFYTSEKHLSTYFGIAYHRNNGLIIQSDQRKRSNLKNLIVFADVLIDASSEIQKLSYNDTLYDFNTASSGVNQTKIGYRFGFRRDFSKKHGSFWDLEIGKRPQYFGNHFYFQFGLGYAFKTKI